MKTKITTHLLVVSAMTALASVAAGQAVRAGAVAQGVLPPPAATPAVPATPAPAVPAVPAVPPTPTVSAGVAAGATSGVAGSVNTPVARPDLGASADATSRAGANVSVSPGRADVRTDNRSSANPRLTGIDHAVAVTGETSASLRATDTLQQIQATGHATRDQVTSTVQERIAATNGTLGELRARAEAAGEKSKAAFARALTEVRQREQAVRANLREAAKASGENWGKIQSELAQSYGAYAEAVAQAEVAARANP